MGSATILDPRTGRPVDQEFHYRNYLDDAADGSFDWMEDAIAAGRLPESAAAHLEKARARPRASGPTASKQGFNEILAVDVADGATTTATTTEALAVPDYAFAAGDPHIYQGATFKITQYFETSTVVTTPGTITMRLRWGGLGGTAMAATGAFAPSTVATTSAGGHIEFLFTVRSIGAAGSIWTQGKWNPSNFDPTSATTLKNELNMLNIPPYGTAPAVVGSLDTTTAKLLSVTIQFSVVTANTTFINHLRILESVN